MNNKQKYDAQYHKEHYERINILVKKGFKDLVKDRAMDLDKSISQYIVDLIMQDLNKRDYLSDIDIK